MRSRWLRALGTVTALGLLTAAILAVRGEIGPALDTIAAAPVGMIAMLLATVLASILLTGGMYSALMGRYGRVGIVEMQTLMAGAALANYLPLRPGLFGRLAYHKAVNDIPLRHGAATVLQSLIISAVLAGFTVGVAIASSTLGWPALPVIGAAGVLLVGVSIVPSRYRLLLLAALLRFLDVLVTAVRYHTSFALIGHPIDSTTALALAGLGMLAALIPLMSNGLGLREWVIGLTAPLLTETVRDIGITADLVNRAAEVLMVLPLGGIALLWITRRVGRFRAADPPKVRV